MSATWPDVAFAAVFCAFGAWLFWCLVRYGNSGPTALDVLKEIHAAEEQAQWSETVTTQDEPPKESKESKP